MTRVGYARCSSQSQSTAEQERRLAEAGCDLVRAEKESGKSAAARPELQTVLAFLRPGDALVVTRLDRLARSVRDLCEISARLDAAGASLVVLDQSVDTTTPAGKMFFHVLGAVAEFERELTRERQAAGIAAARRDGRSLGGRKRSIDRSEVRGLLAAAPDIPLPEVARRLRIGVASVYRIVGELAQENAK
jgi:DNA invertase Pin-like site-specific DNA recombinase